MYSVILMAAMATNGPDMASFGHHRRAASCYGCTGCSGCCGGCYGNSGYGMGGCHGCYGGCYGSGYANLGGTACYGGCYGCYGCGGCHGNLYGYGWGNTYAPGAYAYPGNNPMVAPPAGGPAPAPRPADPAAPKPGTSARLIIELPADAELFVDEIKQPTSGPKRTFATPVLDANQMYYYTVRVEMKGGEKPISESRRVLVNSGEVTKEYFRETGIQTAAAGK